MDQNIGQKSPSSIALLSAPVILAVASGLWLQQISSIVPEPYLDEVFHVRQAQAYCAGKYTQWDPKITTPPGLYMLSAAVSTVFHRCDILTLRALNVFGIFGIFFTAFGCQLRLKRQKTPVAKQLLTQDDDVRFLKRAYDVHTALNIALFPPLFFFSALYYTDVLSTLYVMMSYDLYLRTSNPEYAGWQTSIEILLSGLLALSCRQTNIFWVAIFPAGLTVVQVLKKETALKKTPTVHHGRVPTFIECIDVAWASGEIHECPILSAQFTDVLKTLLTLAVAITRSPFVIVRAIWPYILLIGVFGAFVVWNGGVVLGDKSNHVATVHLPQMLYIWPYIFFFSAPLLYPYLIRLLWPMIPHSLRRVVQHLPGVNSTSTIPPHWSMLIVSLGIFSILASVVVHFNTIIHPFTLADNRHYVFYIFRILRRPYVKFLVTPVYGICAWACVQALGGSWSRAAEPSRDGETKKASKFRHEGCETSFAIVWLVASALTLCSAPLVEPRYFILPWIMWRLHVPQRLPPRDPRVSKTESPSRKDSSAGGASSMAKKLYLGYDHRLWMETGWFLAVNATTGYMFLHRGFAWPQEPERVQRFMW